MFLCWLLLWSYFNTLIVTGTGTWVDSRTAAIGFVVAVIAAFEEALAILIIIVRIIERHIVAVLAAVIVLPIVLVSSGFSEIDIVDLMAA